MICSLKVLLRRRDDYRCATNLICDVWIQVFLNLTKDHHIVQWLQKWTYIWKVATGCKEVKNYSDTNKEEKKMKGASLSCCFAQKRVKCLVSVSAEKRCEVEEERTEVVTPVCHPPPWHSGQHDRTQSQQMQTLVCPVSHQSKCILSTNCPDRHSQLTAPLLPVSKWYYLVCFLGGLCPLES